MTSEVVLMNRRAVALAADSATTVSRWVRGKRKTRYFKGANKLFHLSICEPVGLMINGAGNLEGVPWEILIKSFREDLGRDNYPTLKGYARRFFGWLQKNSEAFPKDFLERQFVAEAMVCAKRIAYAGFKEASQSDGADDEQKAAIITAGFQQQADQVRKATLIANATRKNVAEAISKLSDAVAEAFEKHRDLNLLCSILGKKTIIETSITAVFKNEYSSLDQTGIIVTGFGEKDYFPSIESYNCYGNVLGKLIYERDEYNCKQISQDNTSEIRAFAKAEMIHTFMFGANVNSLVVIDALNEKALDKMESALAENNLLSAGTDIGALKSAVHEEFKESVTDYFRSEHIGDLRSVVGMLPIEELAELAETLVLIESLKERVTTDEESVSGPIDVAVISKNEGLIWIKRKHYFNHDLNPRYFAGLRETMRYDNG